MKDSGALGRFQGTKQLDKDFGTAQSYCLLQMPPASKKSNLYEKNFYLVSFELTLIPTFTCDCNLYFYMSCYRHQSGMIVIESMRSFSANHVCANGFEVIYLPIFTNYLVISNFFHPNFEINHFLPTQQLDVASAASRRSLVYQLIHMQGNRAMSFLSSNNLRTENEAECSVTNQSSKAA